MKNNNSVFIVLLLIICVTGIGFLVQHKGPDKLVSILQLDNDDDIDDADDETSETDRLQIIDGHKAVILDNDLLQLVGLEIAPLEERNYSPEKSAFAEVLDISGLVELKTEFAGIDAKIHVHQTRLSNERKKLEHARALYEAKALSSGDLENQAAIVREKASELNALVTELENFKFQINSEWGSYIAGLIAEPDRKDEFSRLARYENALILLTIPGNKKLFDINKKVFFNQFDHRETAIAGKYIEQAKKSSHPLLGNSYIYLLDDGNLSAGLRLFAWIEETDAPINGIFIPDNAVIWYADEPWVYIRHNENIYIRKPVTNAMKINNGWLVTGGFEVNEPVVISGSQTLLSEEFKWAIPDEDDD